jgi:hypothetical protein
MTTRQKLIDHLANLKLARDEAFATGDWEHVDYLGLCIDDTQDALTAQNLIEAIKAKPGHQVFQGSTGGAVIVAITRANSVAQRSVWLGRRSTIENLQAILAA